MKDILEVSEIYMAPQGEGPYLGVPSLFLRLRRCVLQCTWCDTKQTWQPGFPGYDDFESYPPEFLVKELQRVATKTYEMCVPGALVITGGEPLIWQRLLPQVIDSYTSLVGEPLVEVETAGTIVPSAGMLNRCHFNVSPKLGSAGNEHVSPARLWNVEATKLYLTAASASFKIVVGQDDETMVRLYLSWLLGLATECDLTWPDIAPRIFLMPCAATREELIVEQPKTIDLAQRLGVNVTTRLQVLAYSDERRR